MRRRFRDFIRTTPFSLREGEAAPSMGGAPTPPPNPGNTSNKHHFTMLKGQLGVDDQDFDTAMEDQSVTIWLPQDYSQKWGFEVAGTTQATVKRRSDGNWDVTFQLPEKKTMLPKSFIYPYKKGEEPMNYKGPVEAKTVVMTQEELENAMSVPFQSGYFQPPQGGAAGGMDGGPAGGMAGGAAPPPTPAPSGGSGGPA